MTTYSKWWLKFTVKKVTVGPYLLTQIAQLQKTARVCRRWPRSHIWSGSAVNTVQVHVTARKQHFRRIEHLRFFLHMHQSDGFPVTRQTRKQSKTHLFQLMAYSPDSLLPWLNHSVWLCRKWLSLELWAREMLLKTVLSVTASGLNVANSKRVRRTMVVLVRVCWWNLWKEENKYKTTDLSLRPQLSRFLLMWEHREGQKELRMHSVKSTWVYHLFEHSFVFDSKQTRRVSSICNLGLRHLSACKDR